MYKKIIFLIFAIPTSTILPAIGFARAQKAAAYEQANNLLFGQPLNPSSSSSNNQSCTPCSTTSTTTTPMPNFVISFYQNSSSTTALHSYVFQTNSSFTYSNALLYVDIFPPSNNITNTGVTTDSSYAIVYTLKTPNGDMLQKSIEYMTNSTPITMASIPTAISVGVQTAATTTSTTANNITTISQNYFLPNLQYPQSHKQTTQQRIFNNICPLSQVFWINYDDSGTTPQIQAVPIESTLNTNAQPNANTQASVLTNPFSTFNPISGSKMNVLRFTLQDSASNSQLCTFGGGSSVFGISDLQNGLMAHIHIYPPSSSAINNAYIVIFSLQTLDGLKFHKQVFTAPSFTAMPCLLQITSNNNANLILSSNITNTSNTQQTINFIAPLRIRCFINATSACLV